MEPERRRRMEAIRHEQLSREHGWHELPGTHQPAMNEDAANEREKHEAFNSKGGYC